jgi:hypothetical protein
MLNEKSYSGRTKQAMGPHAARQFDMPALECRALFERFLKACDHMKKLLFATY